MMLENAREQGAEAYDRVHVLEVLFDGDRAVGVRIKEPDGTRRDVAAKVVVDASGQAALLQNRFKTRRVGSGAEQGRDLDLLGGRVSRHRPRRRRHHGAPDRRPQGLVLEHPAPRQHRQSRCRGAVRRTVQESRYARADLHRGSGQVPGGEGPRQHATRVTGYFATRDYSYRSTAVAGHGWVLVGDAFQFLDPLYSSGVLLALEVGRARGRRDHRRPEERRHQRRAARRLGPDVQRGRGPHAPAGVRVLRRLQLRQVRARPIRT